MKKFFKSLFAAGVAMAIGVGMAMMIQPANANPGAKVKAYAWCLKLEDMKLLAAAMAEDGQEGYIAIIDAQGNSCLDTVRVGRWGPNGTSIDLELVEKVLAFDYEGKPVEVWSAKDQTGKIGWIWMPAGPSA